MNSTPLDDASWTLFTIGSRRLAVPAKALREVVPLPTLSNIRGGNLALRGTMPYRNGSIPVLGGRRLLGLPPTSNRSSNRPFWAPKVHVPTELAVILRIRGRTFALSVDGVVGVKSSPADARVFHPAELAHLCSPARVP